MSHSMLGHNSQALSLRVPSPPSRPGTPPDFSALSVPEAGALPRPPVDVDPATIRDFAYGMIRVLNEDGAAKGEWRPELSPDMLRRGLRAMMLTRAYDVGSTGATGHRVGHPLPARLRVGLFPRP